MANNITIKIASDVSDATKGINSINQRLEALQRASEGVRAKLAQFSTIAGGAVIAFNAVSSAIQGIANVVREMTAAYAAQEQAEIKLQSVLNATKNAVGMSVSELQALADAFQKVTTYTDQEILAVEQYLVATRKISREIMPEATKAVLDMAAATGDDAVGAAHDLAQALADPAGEIESLKEKGIQLTEAQADNIKKVQEQNGLYAAQKLLLKEVEGTYGGIAEALASTDTGKLTQLQNAWQDLKEGLGEMMMNSLQGLVDFTLSLVSGIEKMVNGQNRFHSINTAIEAGTTDWSGFSNDEIGKAYDLTYDYRQYLANKPDSVGMSDYEYAIARGFSPEEIAVYNAIINERNKRQQMSVWGALDSAYGTHDVRRPATEEEIVANQQAVWRAVQAKVEEELAASPETVSASAASIIGGDVIGDFISSNRGLSASAQLENINSQIWQASMLMANPSATEDQRQQLLEIITALNEEKMAIQQVNEEAADGSSAVSSWVEGWEKAKPIIDEVVSACSNFLTSVSDLFSTLADTAASKLDDLTQKWDDYFDELDEKQDRQAESLNALLSAGLISYEDYINGQQQLDEDYAAAEEQRMAEEEEQREKANSLAEAAFNAQKVNSVAQAVINIAEGVTKAIAQGGVAGIAMGALVSAAGAIQIGTIAAQQYTPMAAGGIVTSPTHALIGEGGSPEMVLPLTDDNVERYIGGGVSGGAIYITVNIGTSYSGSQLAEDVFRGIERAQKEGALPNWRYA